MLMKAEAYFVLLTLFALALLSDCGGSVAVTSPRAVPSGSAGIATPSTKGHPAMLPANRVEVVYFHMPQRCGTCLCFGRRISSVVSTYFASELANGKLSFTVCELGDRKKADLIRRYDAFTTQLFVNTIQNNVDHIKYIEETWSWHCVANTGSFDENVRKIIEQALEDAG